MNLKHKTVVLTGAAGGIGTEIAKQLDQLGASLILVDLNEAALNALSGQLAGEHKTLMMDLTSEVERASLQAYCSDLPAGIDILINSAGLMDFAFLQQQDSQRLQLLMQVNVIMPMLVTQSLLPLLVEKSTASIIVNVGSTFGSIGFPGFSAYCSSKFALRGFTETLRRELSDGPVDVLYVAPRAAATKLNNDAITQMNKELNSAMDPPEVVARAVISAMQNQKSNSFIGWPEKLFVRINGLFPKLIDNALKKQLPVIRRFAQLNSRSH